MRKRSRACLRSSCGKRIRSKQGLAPTRRILLLLFDHKLGRPLPFQDEIGDGESGNGYALRMLCANGLQFADLARAAASIGHTYMPASAVPYLSYAFGASLARLQRAIPRTYSRKGRRRSAFLGHDFSRTYQLRYTRPQVCPACLAVPNARLLAVWEISLYTSCVVHGCLLADRCVCGKGLLWRRIGPFECSCGADLRVLEVQNADPGSLAVSSLVSAHVSTEQPEHGGIGLQDHLGALSLDTLLRLVRALGISESTCGDDLVPGRLTRLLSSVEAVSVVNRAWARLAGQDTPVFSKPPPPWQLEELLGGATSSDMRVLRALLGDEEPAVGRWLKQQRWKQLDLLEGGVDE
ncbi:TniQ family protein [Achromobacter spanius]|uniref:TniQ family protein n=1 Tax=Achromobacter spanius TaxID=217203 RepID=UPI0036EA79E9